jgi:hypothetical protein
MKDTGNDKWASAWQKAFDDASLEPPQRVWEAVERSLDDTEPAASARRPKRYGLLLLLLLAGSGLLGVSSYWYSQSGSSVLVTKDVPSVLPATPSTAGTADQVSRSQGGVVVGNKSGSQTVKSPSATLPTQSKESLPALRGRLLAQGRGIILAETGGLVPQATPTPSPLTTTVSDDVELADTPNVGNQPSISEKTITTLPTVSKAVPPRATPSKPEAGALNRTTEPRESEQPPTGQAFESLSTPPPVELIANTPVPLAKYLVEPLASLPPPTVFVQWTWPLIAPVATPPPVRSVVLPRWEVGWRVMIASFDPNLRQKQGLSYSSVPVVSTPTTGLPQSNTNQIGSQSGASLLTDLYLKYNLNSKWSLEGGVQYLRGNSTLQSNALVINRNNSQRENLYSILVSNSKSSSTSFVNDNIVLASNVALSSRYEYLSVPLGVGYEAKVFRALGWHLRAGVSGDAFLKHTIQGYDPSSLNAVIYRPSNKVYRQVNLSAFGGLGLHYSLTKRWVATLDATYRHTVFNAIPDGDAIVLRPRTAALGLGLRYRFSTKTK